MFFAYSQAQLVKFNTENWTTKTTSHKNIFSNIEISLNFFLFIAFAELSIRNIENGPPMLPTQNANERVAASAIYFDNMLASFVLLFIELWLFGGAEAHRAHTNDTEYEW